MTASVKYAQLVPVTVKKGDKDVFVATSATLRGLLVVSKDFNKLVTTLVPEAIVALYAACNQEIVVAPIEGDPAEPQDHPFVAIPAAVARQALEAGLVR